MKTCTTKLQAIELWNAGETLHAVHDMDEKPSKITSMEMLESYTPECIAYSMTEKPENPQKQSRIVWKLPRALKGRYVRAARARGMKLIQWIRAACDTAAGNQEEK